MDTCRYKISIAASNPFVRHHLFTWKLFVISWEFLKVAYRLENLICVFYMEISNQKVFVR